MRKLTKEEFVDRSLAMARAKKIYLEFAEKNVTKAWEMYQELLAEKPRQMKLSRVTRRDYGIFSNKKRPVCPECNEDMLFRNITTPQGPANLKGWKSCWVCDKCYYEKYSTRTMKDWLQILENKENE
jgi:transposase-like protein